MSLLGISIRQAGCRLLAVDRSGQVTAAAQQQFGRGPPARIGANDLIVAVRDGLRDIAQQTRRDPIEALAVTSSGESVVALSSEGEALSYAFLATNSEHAQRAQRISSQLGEEALYLLTGRLARQAAAIEHICWLRDERRPAYWRTWRFVPPAAFVTNALGGTATVDLSLASGTSLLDLNQRQWSSRLLDQLGIARTKLPDIREAGTAIGTLSAGLERDLGLHGVRIVQGAHEMACAALGAGVYRSGMCLYHLGASLDAVPAFGAIPITSLMYARDLPTYPHVRPGLFLSQVHSWLGGRALQWFVDRLASSDQRLAKRSGANFYARLLGEMPSEPSNVVAVPTATRGRPCLWSASASGRCGAILSGQSSKQSPCR